MPTLFKSASVFLAIAAIAPILPLIHPNLASAQGRLNLESPVSQRVLEMCKSELNTKVGAEVLLNNNSLREYYVSQNETRIRGRGDAAKNGKSQTLLFDCVININSDRITKFNLSNVTATVVKGKEATAYVATPLGGRLNLRKGAGLSYPIVGKLVDKTQVQLSGRTSNNWAETLDGHWLYRPYVRYE